MASVNKVILIGNLGKDPETRYAPSGDAICNFSIATTESWKDKNSGEKKEQTEWHRISMFGKLAEIASQYLKKGSSVYIEGSLRTREWTDKEGQKRYTTEIRADSMKMLGGRPDGGSNRGGGNDYAPDSGGYDAPPPNRNAQGSPPNRRSFDDLGDDIPFAPIARGIAGHCF